MGLEQKFNNYDLNNNENSQEKISSSNNVNNFIISNNEIQLSRVSIDNNDLLFKRRNFNTDSSKKFSQVMKSSTFNSEEMYRKFNQEFDFKKMKNKKINKSKDNNQIITNKSENKNQIINGSIKENKNYEENKFKDQKKVFTTNSNKKTVLKQSTSLNYKFSVKFLKSPERPNSNDHINNNFDNNPYIPSQEKRFKNNYLHSFSVYNRKPSPSSSQSNDINHSSSNFSKKILHNSNTKRSNSSLKSNKSRKSIISKDSSKFNYRMFKNKENSITSHAQEKYIENLRSSNPNTLIDNLKDSILLPRLRNSTRNTLNEAKTAYKRSMIVNKDCIKSSRSINNLSNKFNFNNLTSLAYKNEENDFDNSFIDINDRKKSKLCNFIYNYSI